MSDWKSFLGLANRARKIISGEELVLKEVRSGKKRAFRAFGEVSAKILNLFRLFAGLSVPNAVVFVLPREEMVWK